MTLLIDQQYAPRLSLTHFKKVKDNLWNFRCPLCGDSKTDKDKARGYIYRHMRNDYLSFKCHNCGASLTFSKLLKSVDPQMYKHYINQRMAGRTIRREKLKPLVQEEKVEQKVADISIFRNLTSLPADHFAVKYVEKRKIPKNKWNLLFFTDRTKFIVGKLIPDKFSQQQLDKDYSSLVLPLVSKNGMFGFQIRRFDDFGTRYLTYLIDEHSQRLFGEERVDKDKPFFVVEGPIDSLFLSNAIAVCGSDMTRVDHPNAIFVLDCDCRNPHIVKKMFNLINLKRKVVILPSEQYSGMDINDIVLDGEDVESLLHRHTYTGLTALTMYNKWRKVDK